ncbi:MAG: efflux RND transporter periplasmic adaptor subunit [Candidatus Thiodiazotropha sp.]
MKSMHHSYLLASVLAAFLAACDKATPQAAPASPVPEVKVVAVQNRSMPLTHELVGRLAATRIAEVRARVAGIILQRVYQEGTDVEAGQTLFQIDPAPLEAEVHAQEATLVKAQADATNAALTAKRYRGLAAKKLLSSQDLDSALANERTTAAAVKVAEANLEKARLDLSYATVKAPIVGRAGRAMVTEGALVGQDEATQLTTIEQFDPIYVNFSLSVSQLEQLRNARAQMENLGGNSQQTPVEVTLADGSPYAHKGSLDFTDSAADPATGTISLRAVVPNPEHLLLPGMFVNLRLTLGRLENAFLLPQASLGRDGQGAYVLVVNGEGKVEQRRVTTHGMTTSDWIVTGDLAGGDQVILEGLQKVRAGGQAKAVTATDSEQ